MRRTATTPSGRSRRSAISNGSQPVTAWGGPGLGTAELPADQWRSYLHTADHPEYPSASTALCAAHAEAARSQLGSAELGWSVPVAAGSSSAVEPGVAPARDLTLYRDDWTEFARTCGISRLWGGVHFPSAIGQGARLGDLIGSSAYRFLQLHVQGHSS